MHMMACRFLERVNKSSRTVCRVFTFATAYAVCGVSTATLAIHQSPLPPPPRPPCALPSSHSFATP
eukprot:546205-Pleurochrysis_carterae.AAC.1